MGQPAQMHTKFFVRDTLSFTVACGERAKIFDKFNSFCKLYKKYLYYLYNIPSCQIGGAVLNYSQKG